MLKAWLVLSVTVLTVFLTTSLAHAQLVPEWVKTTAKWWAEGLITEREFLQAIEFLIENQIIVLETDEKEEFVITPSVPVAKLIERGVEELKENDSEIAILYFNEALKRNPDNVRALVDKGIATARMGKLAEAKFLFDQAIAVGERQKNVDFRAVVNAGIAVSIYGNHTDALGYFDYVISNSDKVDSNVLYAAYVNKGIVLFEQQKYDDALSQYDVALKINPGRLGAIVNKANALQEMQRYSEALEWFEKAYRITTDPLRWKPTFIIAE